MPRELLYTFQELPLIIDNGYEAGLVNGQALLSYWPDGEWGLVDIYLDGMRERSEDERDADRAKGLKLIPRIAHRPVSLKGHPLFSLIWTRLEDEWRDRVQDAVNNAIEQEREAVNA